MITRPLLFASVDPAVAAGRGVAVRVLAVVFLVLLAAAAAEVAQITGTLLVFALLVVPAATAQALPPRPVLSVLLTVALGQAITWPALFIAYYEPYPIGFFVTTFAFAVYLAATGWRHARSWLSRHDRGGSDLDDSDRGARGGRAGRSAPSSAPTGAWT